MILVVDRSKGAGTIRLAQFPPTDYRGSDFSMEVAWPKGGPGGDWWFRGRLVDAERYSWSSDTIQSPNPNGPEPASTYLIPWLIGPDALPPRMAKTFDPSRVTEIWFDCWLSPDLTQTFEIGVDWVILGAPKFAPWSLRTSTLPASVIQTLFGGLISSVQMRDPGASDGTVTLNYTCRDYKLFTDGRTWNKDYTNLGLWDDQIISEVLTGTGLTPSILKLGPIAHTAVLALNFQYQTVTQVLDTIAKATGLVWFIDADGTFNYVVPDSQPVIVALTDQPGGDNFRVDEYDEDFFAPANDVTFIGDGVTAHVYDQASIDTYGLLQWTDYDMRVTKADTALQFAQTDLARSSTPNERGQFTCWKVGAKPGNIVRATAARYGWNQKDFAVQRVEMTQMANRAADTEVVLTVGDYNPTLADAMAQIAKQVATSSGPEGPPGAQGPAGAPGKDGEMVWT
jgi:hypothetical protein